MKKTLFLVAFIAVGALCFCQTDTARSRIHFVETVWDFGNILEGIPVRHGFKYTNKGTAPVIVTNVSGSGGGQMPEWSKEPVAPGKSAVVSVLFGAFNPGNFTKSVNVFFNTGEQFVLRIKGNVIEDRADTPSSTIRFFETEWNFGNIPQNESVKHTFYFVNTGTTHLIINNVTGSGGGVLPSFYTKTPVKPGDTGQVEVQYGAFNPGPFTKNIIVVSNAEQPHSALYLTIKGKVIEPNSESLLPQMKFIETIWDFGEVHYREEVKHIFYFVNVGNAPLIINNVVGSGGGQLPFGWTPEPILPGDTGQVGVFFGSYGYGTFVKTVNVSSNAGSISLIVKGNVVSTNTEPKPPVVNPNK